MDIQGSASVGPLARSHRTMVRMRLDPPPAEAELTSCYKHPGPIRCLTGGGGGYFIMVDKGRSAEGQEGGTQPGRLQQKTPSRNAARMNQELSTKGMSGTHMLLACHIFFPYLFCVFLYPPPPPPPYIHACLTRNPHILCPGFCFSSR